MRSHRLILAALAVTGLLTACSPATDPTPAPSARAGNTQAGYAECLHQQGLVMENYTADDGSTQSRPDKHKNDIARIEAATRACESQRPEQIQGTAPAAADIEAMRRYAACIRSKGVPDYPDPDPATGQPPLSDDLARRIKENPAMRTAMEACRNVLPQSTSGGVNGG
jgi:hypothetical protein